MTENDIWVVSVNQDYLVTEDGKESIMEDDSRVSFADRERAVAFACEMLKNSPDVWRLRFECMSVEGIEDE